MAQRFYSFVRNVGSFIGDKNCPNFETTAKMLFIRNLFWSTFCEMYDISTDQLCELL